MSRILKKENIFCDTLHIRQIFPVDKNIKKIMSMYKKVYIVEHNHNAQLKTVLQNNLKLDFELDSIRKYSGEIFYTHEIIDELKKGII